MKYNERGIRDFKCSFGGENSENKNPRSNSFLDEVRHNFEVGKPRVDVQDSESCESVVLVPEGKIIFR